MKTRNLLLLIILGLGTGKGVYAQTFLISGLVKDSLTFQNLTNVSVYNISLKSGSKTDAVGGFRVMVGAGNNVLKITHVGCDTKYLNVFVNHSFDTIIYLAHHQHELEDIMVVGEKNKLVHLDKDRLNQQEIIISGTKPIASLLDKLPGVSSLKTGYSISKPMIQGMYGSRVIVLNNGIKQEGQQWGQEHGLEIDPYNTSRITLVKGAEALRYTGDAIGGTLLVEPTPIEDNDSLNASITLAGIDNGRQGNGSGSVSKRHMTRALGEIGFRIQGTLKKAGDLKSPLYYLKNTGFEEQNASIAVHLFKTKSQSIELFSSIFNSKIAILSTSHIGNLTDLQKIINSEIVMDKGEFSYKINRPNQHIHHWLNTLKWNKHFSPSLHFELIYGYQLNKRKEYDNHNYFNKTEPSLNFNLNTHQIDLVFHKTFKKGWFLKTGINGSIQTNTYKGRYFIPNYKKAEGYQFSILRYRKNRHELEFGYRAGIVNLDAYKWESNAIEHYGLNYNGVSFQAGWLYKLSADWQIALQAGKMWRNPNISELFSNGLHHGSAAIEYGNIHLKPEEALSGTLVAKYRHNNTRVEFEMYGKQIRNYSYLKPKFPPELTIRGAFPAFNYVQTNAFFGGIDFLLEHFFHPRFSFIEKAGMLNAYTHPSSPFINGIPPYRFDHSINYNPKGSKHWQNLNFKVSVLQVLTQNRYTEGTDYAPPPPGYVLWNVSAYGHIKRYKHLLCFVSAENILNNTYRDYLNRFRYYADENGRMVVAGINIKF